MKNLNLSQLRTCATLMPVDEIITSLLLLLFTRPVVFSNKRIETIQPLEKYLQYQPGNYTVCVGPRSLRYGTLSTNSCLPVAYKISVMSMQPLQLHISQEQEALAQELTRSLP